MRAGNYFQLFLEIFQQRYHTTTYGKKFLRYNISVYCNIQYASLWLHSRACIFPGYFCYNISVYCNGVVLRDDKKLSFGGEFFGRWQLRCLFFKSDEDFGWNKKSFLIFGERLSFSPFHVSQINFVETGKILRKITRRKIDGGKFFWQPEFWFSQQGKEMGNQLKMRGKQFVKEKDQR